MRETLLQLDRALSLSINFLHTDTLDTVMMTISERWTWLPLYALLAFLLFRAFGWKKLIGIAAMTGITIALCDQGSGWMKEHFARLRPCHHPELTDMLHLPAGCGGLYGFVSSHAANTMGLAMMVSMLLRKSWLTWMLIFFAGINGYSRIYLGKHYVLDVLGGFMLGVVVAVVLFQLWLLMEKKIYTTQ